MTRAEFNAIKGGSTPKTMTRAQFNAIKPVQTKTMSRADFNALKAPKQAKSAFNWTTNQLGKPVSMASNALEDTGKLIGSGIASAVGGKSLAENLNKSGFHPLQHQIDVLNGKNQRTYFTFMNEYASKEQDPLLSMGMKAIGYAGDFMLDPLNKLHIVGLTEKGLKAEKAGKLALSMAEQAKNGERALLQVGKLNVLPSVGNRVLAASTGLNDAIRGTEAGRKLADVGAAVSSKIRPGAVSREDFKILTDAKTAARNATQYATDKAINFASDLAKELKKRKATTEERSALLHAVEKGDSTLAPAHLQDIFQKGVDFKAANEETWKKLGGSVLDQYGMAHVATKEVAEAARKDAFKGQGGFKLTSTNTPQDIHRQWAKVDGVVTNLKDAGIKFKDGIYQKGRKIVDVTQATAHEINQAMAEQGKKAIFQEDLPVVAARMGLSTGKKQAATDFLKATKGLKGEEAKALANEVHNKMVNPESLRKAIQMFDQVQNTWKAQALVAPSYHIRNMAGNLWNNFLADVHTPAYAVAGNLQAKIKSGALSKAERKLVTDMEKHGVIGTGQYGGDIERAIDKTIKGVSANPLSQDFALYRGNRAIGSAVEDNAKIAHYISKIADGYSPKQAAESVKKFLFDYGDLTDVEKGVLKRVMPFYTWTSKNIPLQIQQFVENPGKFSKIATAKKDVESGVPVPNEKYMSDYIQSNAPIRTKVDENGNTMYFLAGAWLPAAQAITFLSDPVSNTLGMVTPALKLPYENLSNNGTFFKNTLGQYEQIQKYPGQKTSYLGLDLNPMTVNNLRSIRTLNELNNLNPGGIFGTKNSPSIFHGLIPNASNVRGGQNTPETSQADRIANSFIGKLQGYNPDQSKQYYDRDTQTKITEYNTAINRAISNNQTDLAGNLIKEMEQFVQERNGQPNEALKMYNIIGDQYFKDQAANKLAEKNRDNIREEMKKKIRDGITAGDFNLVTEAMKLDPSYASQAVKDALKEQSANDYSPEQRKMLYDIEQLMTKKRLNPFY